jgi:hypothetical protein
LNKDFDKDPSIYPQSELKQETLKELNQEELDLRVEIRRITSKLDESGKVKAKSGDKGIDIEIEKDAGQIKRELEEKKEELRKVHFEKLMKSQAELLGSLNEGLLNANKAPLNIIDAIYNGQGQEDDSLGQNIDLAI